MFREGDFGATLAFDPILAADQRLAEQEAIVVTRRYRPEHNIGVFRFVVYTRVGPTGQPTGDVVPVGRIVFPFAAELRDGRDLARVPVERTGTGPEIEETYTVDAHGVVRATITDLESGFCVTTAL